ncbi:hypothetical protein ES708_06431 [subsurface metagenome]
MRIQLRDLTVRTRRTNEKIHFSEIVTFIHGPVSTGKSTIVRLIDYCLGGDMEWTPAVQQEFVAADLSLHLGKYGCTLERSAEDTQSVRVTWWGPDHESESVNAPLGAQTEPLIDAEVYNLSDLIFHLCGITPIKVRKRSRDPESPTIRLSFRDIWRYCYLDQTHLDSSFFRLEDPFRGRKSQDAMRFFTGLHSERLSQFEEELMSAIDEQRSKREAVKQIRTFMDRFELGSELDVAGQLEEAQRRLSQMEKERTGIESGRATEIHPTDDLRKQLRLLSVEISDLRQAVTDSQASTSEQKALRAELITAKTKAARLQEAGKVLEGARYDRCPACGASISDRVPDTEQCQLCGSTQSGQANDRPLELEAIRRDLNERIDQIGDSIARRERELSRMKRQLEQMTATKAGLDKQLQQELARYDSAFIERIRGVEREIATLSERIRSLQKLQLMPQAVNALEEEAGGLQGRIDRFRSSSKEERERLRKADANIAAIAAEFRRMMMAVSFPGVSDDDQVALDPRNWRPTVLHGEQEWSFWDTGSGGKKTLFNVCYALALHAVAVERGMPVPQVLIIDSPTKNISEDENPELVHLLYEEIYRLASSTSFPSLQFLLIDSDFVKPEIDLEHFAERRMAGQPDAPSLISYYVGP